MTEKYFVFDTCGSNDLHEKTKGGWELVQIIGQRSRESYMNKTHSMDVNSYVNGQNNSWSGSVEIPEYNEEYCATFLIRRPFELGEKIDGMHNTIGEQLRSIEKAEADKRGFCNRITELERLSELERDTHQDQRSRYNTEYELRQKLEGDLGKIESAIGHVRYKEIISDEEV